MFNHVDLFTGILIGASIITVINLLVIYFLLKVKIKYFISYQFLDANKNIGCGSCWAVVIGLMDFTKIRSVEGFLKKDNNFSIVNIVNWKFLGFKIKWW